ncbi:MAG: FIST C-terminal domain-containing protein [Chitinophagales bacterium]|nr:FIST C-terminal domain-containing protein [Chitinophagales bacterium]
MLTFFSASTRMVNSRRGITECMESALGADTSDCDLVIIHASLGHDFTELIETAGTLAPRAKVLAASCCGVVGKEGVSESMKDIAVMAIKGKEFSVAGTDGIFGHNSFEKTKAMAEDLYQQQPDTSFIYFLASGIDIANDRCIAAIESVFGKAVTIFGATSSDNMKGVVSYQAYDGHVHEHGAFLVGFADPTLEVITQATHGFVAIGDPMVVTKAEGHCIYELDGKPAWTEYTRRLGLDASHTCGDTIPVGALAEKLASETANEYGNEHILRVVTRHEGEAMLYATTCPVGTRLWLTVRDEPRIFNEMDRMVKEMDAKMGGRKPVAVFHADCLARGRFLFNRVLKEELVSRMQFPFSQNGVCPPWLGMYGFGEFARLGGENTYHNYTTALYTIYRK